MSKIISVYAFGEVGWELRLADVVAQTQGAAPEDVVNVIINSPGGDVSEGFAIHDYLVDLKSKVAEVNTEIFGMCASIATVIALSGDKRIMNENAQFMIHNPWGGPVGDADQIQRYADELRKIENRLVNFYSTKTGGDEVAIQEMMNAETYMSPDQALSLGFITEVKSELKAVAKIKIENPNKMSNTNTKGIIAQIKSLFKALDGEAPIALDVTLADGTLAVVETESDAPAVGDAVTVAGDPAPDGTHVLADGSSITTVGGVITEMNAMKEDDEDYEAMKAENEALKNELQTAVQALEDFKNELQAKAKKTSQQFNMKRDVHNRKKDDAPATKAFDKNKLKEVNLKKK